MNIKQRILLTSFVASQIILALLVIFPDVFGVNLTPPSGYSSVAKLVIGISLALGTILLYGLLFSKKELAISRKMVLVISVIIWGVYTILPPLGSQDIFFYIGEGRVLSVYQENPYLVPIGDFPQDKAWHLVYREWKEKPGIYGPIWTAFEGGVAYVGNHWNIEVQVLFLKVLMLIAHVGTSYLLYKSFVAMKQKGVLFKTLFYAWNPVILFEFVNNGHSEGYIALFFVGAWLALLRSKKVASIFLIVLAGLIKINFLVLFPVWIVYFTRYEQEKKKKIFQYSLLAGSVIALSYVPWYDGMGIFSQLLGRVSMFSEYGMPLIYTITYSLADYANIAHEGSMMWAHAASWVLFLLSYGMIIMRVAKGKTQSIALEVGGVLMVMVLTIAPSMQPWYFLWPIVFFVLAGYYRVTMFLLGFTALFYFYGVATYLMFDIFFVWLLFFSWNEHKKISQKK